MGSKGKKRTSVLGLYEATDILLLLTHATIYSFDATLKYKSTMTATPMASYVRSILQTTCTVNQNTGVKSGKHAIVQYIFGSETNYLALEDIELPRSSRCIFEGRMA